MGRSPAAQPGQSSKQEEPSWWRGGRGLWEDGVEGASECRVRAQDRVATQGPGFRRGSRQPWPHLRCGRTTPGVGSMSGRSPGVPACHPKSKAHLLQSRPPDGQPVSLLLLKAQVGLSTTYPAAPSGSETRPGPLLRHRHGALAGTRAQSPASACVLSTARFSPLLLPVRIQRGCSARCPPAWVLEQGPPALGQGEPPEGHRHISAF